MDERIKRDTGLYKMTTFRNEVDGDAEGMKEVLSMLADAGNIDRKIEALETIARNVVANAKPEDPVVDEAKQALDWAGRIRQARDRKDENWALVCAWQLGRLEAFMFFRRMDIREAFGVEKMTPFRDRWIKASEQEVRILSHFQEADEIKLNPLTVDIWGLDYFEYGAANQHIRKSFTRIRNRVDVAISTLNTKLEKTKPKPAPYLQINDDRIQLIYPPLIS